ncbi:hypothetical protein N9M41_08010 [Rhodopirellula sp.]|nr:hypothetical protein [Rhodopirellula sp.]
MKSAETPSFAKIDLHAIRSRRADELATGSATDSKLAFETPKKETVFDKRVS